MARTIVPTSALIFSLMNIILFDSPRRVELLPLTHTRPVGDLRIGILTIAEKWARRLGGAVSYLTENYLAPLYPLVTSERNVLLNGAFLPTVPLLSFLRELAVNTAYFHEGELIAAELNAAAVQRYATDGSLDGIEVKDLPHLPLFEVRHPADLFTQNGRALTDDFEVLVAGNESAPLPPSNLLIGPADQLFLEEGVSIQGCTINCTTGPVYIARDAVILEGSQLRGPIAINAGAVVKMGTRIYGATTIGPQCKVGGEINNVIFQANSNKGHDGFLGNAVIGAWCNLGAGTNASNLKNDYGNVKVYSYTEQAMRATGLQFHGLVMGDHSKCGINTMFNTGTVVGFSCNVFGAGFPPTFLPSFTWGGAEGLQPYRLDKAMDTGERVMARRGQLFGQDERRMFTEVFRRSAGYRE